MSNTKFTEYSLAQDAYAAFDATTLKGLLISKLNESEVFRDQNFEGSNLNAFIDVVAYMYHVLLFYLNTTSTEATFTTATLYENINRLVSNIGYKPLGRQTSIATISLSALDTLTPDLYTVPRFSSIVRNGVIYASLRDIAFEKTNTNVEEVFADNTTLFQGNIIEYPSYSATGESFETITIVNKKPDIINSTQNDNTIQFIADNTFTVFVKSVDSGVWKEWAETPSLYLEDANSRRYEKRINEYGNYVFKFGNNLYGKSLKEGDVVQIYYILSDNQAGVVNAGVLGNSSFVIYNTEIFNEITQSLYGEQDKLLTPATTSSLIINNITATTPVVAAESADDIKANAPKLFSLQNRLVTRGDYETLISKRFNSVVKSAKVLSNNEYTSQYLRYFYSIGLSKPNENSRVLFNQVNFSNSTLFNNVYIFTVPQQATILDERIPNYLNPAQKQLIVNECNEMCDLTHNIVPSDPIYKAFSIGANIVGERECIEIKDFSKIVIKRDKNVSINNTTLKNDVVKLFKRVFDNISLGSIVELTQISNEILNMPGVESVATRRTDTNFEVPYISCVVWNPLYEEDDVIVTSQNVKLADFQYGYFYETTNLFNNIIIE
jgi:hypothetical protein